MGDTTIAWTNKTWNPLTGCEQCSEGCQHCYAKQLHDMRHKAYLNGKKMAAQYAQPFNVIQCFDDRLTQPLKWRQQSNVFINSMGDLFHRSVPTPFIDRVMGVVALAKWHTFQSLTKRADRLYEYFSDPACRERVRGAMEQFAGGKTHLIGSWPLPNLWLGVTAENQRAADERIPLLLQTPAAVRWISAEPLLGPVDVDCFLGRIVDEPCFLGNLDWVVCGGESGPNARPMHPDWARSLRDQCQEAGVPFFFKQWGEWAPALQTDVEVGPRGIGRRDHIYHFSNAVTQRFGKKLAGRLLDGREWNEYPEAR